MLSQTASFLCIIFILYLFIMDLKHKPNVSRALWIPLIWMMILLSRPVSQWFNIGDSVQINYNSIYEGSPLDRIVYGFLIIIGLIIIMRRKIAWSRLLKEYRWLFGYFLYCGISILWSDFPYISLKRWIKDIGGFIIILVIATEARPFEAIQWIVRKCGYVLIPLSILFIKYYSHIGRGYSPSGEAMYQGVAIGKNELGILCLICAFFYFIEIMKWQREGYDGYDRIQKISTIILLCMTTWVMFLSNSLTSFTSLLFGIFVLVSLGSRAIRENIKKPMFLVICGALFTVFFMLIGNDIYPYLLNLMGRSPTLTDRTFIWTKVLSMETNPLIGCGFESFWLGGILKTWEGWYSPPNQSHNGYLEIYVNLGVIGLILIGGIFVSFTGKAIKNIGSSLSSGRVQLSFFLMFFLYNISEYGFRPIMAIWFVFLTMGILFFRRDVNL